MKFFLRSLLIFVLLSSNAKSASIIRDAEIEHVLRMISDPIFIAARQSPENIRIFIINDPQINAYVTGGSNIFVYTGLVGLSKDPSILTGVIAHETGHISGGHLIRSVDAYQSTSIKAALGYMVGLAAAAAGSPQAGVAIASGATHAAQRQLLKHSRTQEESADQAALKYLDRTKQSSEGLLKLLETLYSRENAMYDKLNPYTLTHPLSRERISNVQNHLNNSKYSDKSPSIEIQKAFERAVVKLNAFLKSHEITLEKYPQSDKSINAHYARAIAYYKQPNVEKALSEIDSLIKLEPLNPFFNELKGQILFENGRVKESINYYKKASELLSDSPLLRIILATAQISSFDKELLEDAIINLKYALLKEKESAFAWRQLAIAYGRNGNLGMSNLSLAEESLLLNKPKQAKKFLAVAKEHIKEGSPAYLKLQDLQSSLDKKDS